MSGELGRPTVKLLIVVMSVSSDISCATIAESSPPESSSPKPTSLIRRLSTAAFSFARVFAVVPVGSEAGGLPVRLGVNQSGL